MRRHIRICNSVAVVVACAGMIDAALGSIWDQFAILLVVALLCLAALLMTRSNRVDITIRTDLGVWLRSQAAVDGETLDAVVDRALATARHHLRPETDTNGAAHRSLPSK